MNRSWLEGKLRKALRDQSWARPLRLARLGRKARSDGHTDWYSFVANSNGAWKAAVERASGPRVLIATNTGINFAATRFDSLLAVALTLRGARVEFLLCNEALPACMSADQSWYPDYAEFERSGLSRDVCRHCFNPAKEKLARLGLPIRELGTYIPAEERRKVAAWADTVEPESARSLVINGVPVGETALSGALRFFARGSLPSTGLPVLRAYLRAARLTQIAFERLNGGKTYDTAILHHGIYVPQGTAASVLRSQGTRIVTWFPAYRKGCFVFSHDDTYHHTMMSEPVDTWENLHLPARHLDALMAYLDSRRSGENDWISFNRNPDVNGKKFLELRGIDPNKPLIGLLTNVAWDAQLHYPSNIFASMAEWLIETVRYFAKRPDLQLVIRAHPAEVTGLMPARETARDILAGMGPLPRNVFFVGPEDPSSTYMISALCKACIIYATKTGIELLTMGIPVVAAGEAWIRGKGMIDEAPDKAAYFAILDRLPNVSVDMSTIIPRAQNYAFHFFFRRMIPVKLAAPVPEWPPFRVEAGSVAQFEPGADVGLDIICDGILNERPFIYPAELIA
jgi:hypothetical protein